MKPAAYYNEIDPYAAAWIRNLIAAGHVAPGEVDTRSIEDVHPADLQDFTQVHMFAGIAVWSLALRRAGWSDDRPVWTGSCPCQPFSAAGKGAGIDDERHLLPTFIRLIAACRPSVVMGEQVSSNLVTGKRASQNLQRLWERKARLGILADWLEKDLSVDLQGLQEQDRSHFASDAKGFNRYPSIEIGGVSKVEGRAKGASIRLDGGMGASGSGLWSLRDHGNFLRPNVESGLELSVDRSDRGRQGLHSGELQSDSVWPKRGMRDMGREHSNHDGQRDHEEAAAAIRRATEAVDRAINEEDGGAWVDTLQTELEALGYAVGAVPFPSAGVGAPHIRDRLYWVAHAAGTAMRKPRSRCVPASERAAARWGDNRSCSLRDAGGLGVAYDGGFKGSGLSAQRCIENDKSGTQRDGEAGGRNDGNDCRSRDGLAVDVAAGPTNGFWRDADWLGCRDGRWRPVEPGTFPLAHGAAARVERLRAYGNAINAEAARVFIQSVMEAA